MKPFIKSILISFLTLEVVFAQIDTTLKDYFPMEIGNIWEYEEQMFPDYWHYQIKVIGDTIMPNGKIYRVFVGKNEPEFYRIDDSLNVYAYRFGFVSSEYLAFKIGVSDRTVWEACFLPNDTMPGYIGLYFTELERFYPDLFLNADTKFFTEVSISGTDTNFSPLTPKFFIPVRLGKGLGVTWTQFEGPAHNLVGAIINGKKIGNITSVDQNDINSLSPQTVEIRNYPNPFNTSTTITVQVNEGTYAHLAIFNVLGQEVKNLMDGFLERGTHRFHWNGKSNSDAISPSGIYFCLLQTDNTSKVRVINLIK